MCVSTFTLPHILSSPTMYSNIQLFYEIMEKKREGAVLNVSLVPGPCH